MQYISSFQSCLPQALLKFTITTSSYILLKRSLLRVYDKFTIICQLQGWQPELDSCHCQMFDQNNILWIG